ncbi:MAG TPA: allantoate amidohydrolase [Acidobacteriaceae bacterium]|jgi:allantoate deiminase
MSTSTQTRGAKLIARCRELARITDIPGETTRLFLSPATHGAHALLLSWMMRAGLETRTDDVGNLRGVRQAANADAPTLLLFSHIDTVPNAGAFDGPLGVLLGLAVMEELGTTPLPFHIELIALSEEEGIRFNFPFLSSLAITGGLTAEHLTRKDRDGVSLADAIRAFGLEPDRITETCPLPARAFAALEVHIEQGPVLESEDGSLAVVHSIIGQSRLKLTFEGQANHAGTTPMPLRRDALAAAAQWIAEVERFALEHKQLVATVGRMEVLPGAVNVVPGTVHLTLDVRHPSDESRHAAVGILLTKAQHAGECRGVQVRASGQTEQRSVPMDAALTTALDHAAVQAGYPAQTMFSGAGHDAMILAPHIPTTMLFVRSPGGLSHHPDEDVREEDVEAAIAVVLQLIRDLRPSLS